MSVINNSQAFLGCFMGIVLICNFMRVNGYAHPVPDPYQHQQIQPRIQTLQTQPAYNGGISSSSTYFTQGQRDAYKIPTKSFETQSYSQLTQHAGFPSNFLTGVSVQQEPQPQQTTQQEVPSLTRNPVDPFRVTKVTFLSSIAKISPQNENRAIDPALVSHPEVVSNTPAPQQQQQQQRYTYQPFSRLTNPKAIPTSPPDLSHSHAHPPFTPQNQNAAPLENSLAYQNAVSQFPQHQNPLTRFNSLRFPPTSQPQPQNQNLLDTRQLYQNALNSNSQFALQQQSSFPYSQNTNAPTPNYSQLPQSFPTPGPQLSPNPISRFTQNAELQVQSPNPTQTLLQSYQNFQSPSPLRQTALVEESPQLQDIPTEAGKPHYNQQNPGRLQYNPNTGKLQYNPNAGLGLSSASLQYNPIAAANIPFIQQQSPLQYNTQLGQGQANNIQFPQEQQPVQQPPISNYPNQFLNQGQAQGQGPNPFLFPQNQQQQFQGPPPQGQGFPPGGPPPPGFPPGGPPPGFEPENGFNPNFLQTFPEPPYESEFSNVSPLDSKDAVELEAYRAKLRQTSASRVQPPDFGLQGNQNFPNAENEDNLDYRIVSQTSRNTSSNRQSPEDLVAIANSKPVPQKCAYNTVTKSLDGQDCLEIKKK